MRPYPELDPVAVSLGPLQIHWYGISYLAGLGLAWWLLSHRGRGRWSKEQISDLIFYGAVGIVCGGRLGYMLFYGFERILEEPLNLFKVWEGGMSFHGGMLGVFVALYLFARKQGMTFFQVADFIAPAVPLGLGMGRLGNFVNAELPGRVTDLPWALVFPGDSVARHPSSLYQFALEGPVLFLLLFTFSSRPRPTRAVSGAFLTGYGCLRMVSESFREPDPQLSFIAFDWLTMGQLLSLPMVLAGLGLLYLAYGSPEAEPPRPEPAPPAAPGRKDRRRR